MVTLLECILLMCVSSIGTLFYCFVQQHRSTRDMIEELQSNNQLLQEKIQALQTPNVRAETPTKKIGYATKSTDTEFSES